MSDVNNCVLLSKIILIGGGSTLNNILKCSNRLPDQQNRIERKSICEGGM